MKMSPEGIAHLKRFEGLRLEAYKCEAGVTTIGYGHVRDADLWAKAGRKMTAHEADVVLQSDLETYEDSVTYFLRNTDVTQAQFDALVSLCFNIGVTRFGKSTLLRKLLRGDVSGAADEFLKWCHIGTKPSAGLRARREAERAMFLEGFV